MDVSKYLYPPTPIFIPVIYISLALMFLLFFRPLKHYKWHLSCCSLSNPYMVPLLFSQGGDLGSMTDAHMPRLYLLQWLKSDRALMMLFNDGTFQVNTRAG